MRPRSRSSAATSRRSTRRTTTGVGVPPCTVIADEWEGEGRVYRHTIRTATAINELIATQRLFGEGSPEALACGTELRPLIDRCRIYGITADDLRRRGAELPES